MAATRVRAGEKVIRKSNRGLALGVEALSDKPRRTAQRSPGVVSLVRWAKPPAADGRSQGSRGAKAGFRKDPGIMKQAGAFEGGEGAAQSQCQVGCLLVHPRSTLALVEWPD